MIALLRQLWLTLLLIALPATAALFTVWVHHGKVELGYALTSANQRRQELRREAQQLEVELAAERSPEQLMRRAKSVGLGAPRPEQVMGGRAAPVVER